MRVLIIGSGLIGVTSAYFLRLRGHEVTVIDRAEGPGREASFANGGLLTPSMASPWNTPGCWRELLSSLGRPDAAMQLRLRVLPSLAAWGCTFLRNSRVQAFERNVLSNLRLALHSLLVMETMRQESAIEYGRAARGSLRIFRNEASLDQATRAANRQLSEGLGFQRLSSREAISLEPALAPIARQLAGALHYKADEVGDAHRFCVALTNHLRQQGVEFCFRTEVSSLMLRSGQLTAVLSERGHLAADCYVVAAGSFSTPLLRSVGVRLPVRPAKGYSVTLDDPQKRPALRIPLVDDHLHAAVVPLEGVIRVAGTAEFAGYDRTLNPRRIRGLMTLLKDVLPRAPLDSSTARSWCGLRPVSADGVPIIGPTPISNLWVNTGHGHLGWTMAAGSAQLLADLVSEASPSIRPAPYALARF